MVDLDVLETDRVLERTDPVVVGQLYKLVETVLGIAKEQAIRFWLCEGSVLGAVRHGGIIPWDDDVDLGFFREDEARLWAARAAFQSRGCTLFRWWGGYKCFAADGLPIPGYAHRFPSVDLFPCKAVRGKLVYARLRARLAWPRLYAYVDEVLPLRDRPFGPLAVACPGRPEPYLERLYGAQWRSVARRTFDHEHERRLEGVWVRIVDTRPASYR